MGWFEEAIDNVSEAGSDVLEYVSDRLEDVGSVIVDGNDWARKNVPLVKDVEDFSVGVYDFASDKIDDVKSVAGDVNDWARDHVPLVQDVEDFIGCAYKGALDSNPVTREVKKQMERTILLTLYVPAKKRRTTRILNEFDEQIQEIGDAAQKKITFIKDQLDHEIQGTFSDAINEIVDSKNQKWDQLT